MKTAKINALPVINVDGATSRTSRIKSGDFEDNAHSTFWGPWRLQDCKIIGRSLYLVLFELLDQFRIYGGRCRFFPPWFGTSELLGGFVTNFEIFALGSCEIIAWCWNHCSPYELELMGPIESGYLALQKVDVGERTSRRNETENEADRRHAQDLTTEEN